jgi:hypothetical protein
MNQTWKWHSSLLCTFHWPDLSRRRRQTAVDQLSQSFSEVSKSVWNLEKNEWTSNIKLQK